MLVTVMHTDMDVQNDQRKKTGRRGGHNRNLALKKQVQDAYSSPFTCSFHNIAAEQLIVSYPFRDLDVQHEEVHVFLSLVERQRLGNHCDQHGRAGDTLKPRCTREKKPKQKTDELCDHVSVDKQFHTKHIIPKKQNEIKDAGLHYDTTPQ